MFTTNSGNNRTGWGNADSDKFIAASAAEPDQKKRHAIFQSAEDMLVSREAVVVPVYHYVGIQFYHEDRLGGVSANLTDEHPLRVIHLKAKGR
jgi:ABC-type oligopeptide transport system substrate-binding subunit